MLNNKLVEDVMNEYLEIEKLVPIMESWVPILESLNVLENNMRDETYASEERTNSITLIAIYLKLYESNNAAIELIHAGFFESAKLVTRNALESLFYLRAIRMNDGNIERFQKGENLRVRKMNAVLNTREHFEYIRDRIEEDIELPDKNDCQNTSVEEWARLAGMTFEYDHIYRVLSTAGHTNLHSVSKYLDLSESGKLMGFKTELDYGFVDTLIFSIILVQIYAIDDMDKFFGLGLDSDIKAINDVIKMKKKI